MGAERHEKASSDKKAEEQCDVVVDKWNDESDSETLPVPLGR